MNTTDRRTFLKTAGASAPRSVRLLVASGTRASAAPAPAMPWKKAFMLGGVSSGPILPHFEKLKEAGFEGVELISPNNLDRDEVLKARDKTGLIIHGVSGSVHWKDPLSRSRLDRRRAGLAAICKARWKTARRMSGIDGPARARHRHAGRVLSRHAYSRSQAAIKTLISKTE